MSKILLITENEKSIALWNKALNSKGIEFDAAINAEEGFLRAKNGKPNLMILGNLGNDMNALMDQIEKDPLISNIRFLRLNNDNENRPEDLLELIDEILTPKRVLIAEDDRQLAEILKALITPLNCEIKICYDGAEALKTVKQWNPHLLVLDIMLPVLDGFHICQSINEDEAISLRPKILIISGRDGKWDQKLADACGVEGYLIKPVDNIDFIKRIRKILFQRVSNE